jgi:hypothetical protein
VPGTVGISGLAERILSWVQYPESSCDRTAVWPEMSSAKAGLAAAITDPASTSTDMTGSKANSGPAPGASFLLHMRCSPLKNTRQTKYAET